MKFLPNWFGPGPWRHEHGRNDFVKSRNRAEISFLRDSPRQRRIVPSLLPIIRTLPNLKENVNNEYHMQLRSLKLKS